MRTIAECAADEPYATQIGPFGNALTPEAYLPSGVPLLRGVNVNRGRFHDAHFVFISEEDANRLTKFESFPGDVLLVHKGSLGQIGLMPETRRFQRYIMGNSMLRVRCNRNKLLPEYLHYWLRSPEGQHYLFSRVSQVGVPQIQRPLSTLREAALPVPPLPEQTAIAGVLGALDDKIEQNRRTARALERLARAIFQAWFVDFEPVKAKATGATSFPSMTEQVFDSLPTRFAGSEIGPVPEGWGVKALSRICTLVSGGTPKRSEPTYWGGSIPWYSVKDAPSDGELWVISTAERITHDGLANSAARMVPKGATIISARGTVGKLAMAGMPMAFNQSCYGLLPADGHSFGYLHLLMQTAVAVLQQRTHGSVFDTITRATFDGLLVAQPQSDVVSAFNVVVSPLFDLLLAALQESSKLAEMRDYLLPRLLSGIVRVEVANG
jgi:type I restriction enzyme, S subunit